MPILLFIWILHFIETSQTSPSEYLLFHVLILNAFLRLKNIELIA